MQSLVVLLFVCAVSSEIVKHSVFRRDDASGEGIAR